MTLQLRGLAGGRGGRPLFDQLDAEVQAGEALWVRGGNGRGKTTLLRLLCGLAVPDAGSVRWRGQDIRVQREDFNRDLLYVGHASAVKDDLSAWENVALGARLAGHACSRDQAHQALDQIGLLASARLPARVLSQGQRRRVALARLCLHDAPLAVLDEPFNALDPQASEVLSQVLNRQLSQGGTVVYTTHQAQSLLPSRLHQLDLSPAQPC